MFASEFWVFQYKSLNSIEDIYYKMSLWSCFQNSQGDKVLWRWMLVSVCRKSCRPFLPHCSCCLECDLCCGFWTSFLPRGWNLPTADWGIQLSSGFWEQLLLLCEKMAYLIYKLFWLLSTLFIAPLCNIIIIYIAIVIALFNTHNMLKKIRLWIWTGPAVLWVSHRSNIVLIILLIFIRISQQRRCAWDAELFCNGNTSIKVKRWYCLYQNKRERFNMY